MLIIVCTAVAPRRIAMTPFCLFALGRSAHEIRTWRQSVASPPQTYSIICQTILQSSALVVSLVIVLFIFYDSSGSHVRLSSSDLGLLSVLIKNCMSNFSVNNYCIYLINLAGVPRPSSFYTLYYS